MRIEIETDGCSKDPKDSLGDNCSVDPTDSLGDISVSRRCRRYRHSMAEEPA